MRVPLLSFLGFALVFGVWRAFEPGHNLSSAQRTTELRPGDVSPSIRASFVPVKQTAGRADCSSGLLAGCSHSRGLKLSGQLMYVDSVGQWTFVSVEISESD